MLQVQTLSDVIAITGEQAIEAGLIDGVKSRIDAMHYLTHEIGGKGWARRSCSPHDCDRLKTFVDSPPFASHFIHATEVPDQIDAQAKTYKCWCETSLPVLS